MNNVTVTTLPFEIAPSPIMFYMDYGIKESGKTLTVSYLADDEDGENPVMYCDGMGAIFTSHRNARRSEHERMQEAVQVAAGVMTRIFGMMKLVTKSFLLTSAKAWLKSCKSCLKALWYLAKKIHLRLLCRCIG